MFQIFDMTRRDVTMTVFPAFGRVGFAWIAGSILYGIPHVLANFEPKEVLRLIATERVTIFNLVPTMAAMLLPAQASAARDLSSIRAIVFAGASLPESIREQTVARLCPNIYEYYGMQETGALVVSTPEDRKKRPGLVGQAMTFSEIMIVDDDGRPLEPNQLGEIIGRSPNAVTAYFENAEKSAETFRNGWIHTGDLGSLDDQGYLTIRGRRKRYDHHRRPECPRRGGRGDHPEMPRRCRLRGLRPARRPVGRTRDGPDRRAEQCRDHPKQLDDFCRQHLAGFKTPKEFIIETEALPRTPTGKVQKFLLVERFGRQRR